MLLSAFAHFKTRGAGLLTLALEKEAECFFFRQICATRNALVQLKTVLCTFGQIYATGNALKQLETILSKFGQICATGNALMQLETI